MFSLRARFDPQHPVQNGGTPPAPPSSGAGQQGQHQGQSQRLNLLLTYGGWQENTWADALPRLLEPMGVRSFRATTGREAAGLLRQVTMHIAVVDLRLPLDRPRSETHEPSVRAIEEGGARILELLSRLESPPPTVVVSRDCGKRDRAREMAAALRAGAFAVVNTSADPEQMLRVMQRVLTRFYQDRWPGGGSGYPRGPGVPGNPGVSRGPSTA